MDGQTLAIVAAAVLPGAVLLSLLAWRGRSLRRLAPALALGALASAPALLLERALTAQPWRFTSFGVLFVFALVVAGLVEEACKLGAWYLGPHRWREGHTDEYDSILYAACIGLGFATVENVAYCLHGGLELAVPRALTAVPAHTMFGIVLGSGLAQARVRRRRAWSAGTLVLNSFLLAVLAHGVYDALAFQASLPSLAALAVGLMGGALWSISTVRGARRRSPAYGGVSPRVPSPLGALPLGSPRGEADGGRLARQTPLRALLHGLVPGLGQLCNGEREKAGLFAGLAIANAALYSLACLFAEAPEAILRWLRENGVTLGLQPGEMPAAIAQRDLLPLMFLSALLCGLSLGALDAWNDARCERRPRRASFIAHGAVLSYLAHVALVLAIAFAPLVARQIDDELRATRAQSPTSPPSPRARGAPRPAAPEVASTPGVGEIELTWVRKIDGWKTPAGASGSPLKPVTSTPPDAVTKPATAAAKSAGQTATTSRPGAASARPVVRPLARRAPAPLPTEVPPRSASARVVIDVPPPTISGVPSVTRQSAADTEGRTGSASGAARRSAAGTASSGSASGSEGGWSSYNQYLSYRFHEGHEADLFFHNVSPDVWAVVRYKISGDGRLLDAALLETSGRPWEGDLVLRLIRACAPFQRLPEGAECIVITELFWAQEYRGFPAGSLAESLSRLPDGRRIERCEGI